MRKDKRQGELFLEGEREGFSVKMKGAEARVILFKNVFHVSFPGQCGCDPQSKRLIYWRGYILDRVVINLNTWKIIDIELI